jgi:single-strand DNA-binding protein
MLNTISLMGRFTKNPELRYTQSGTPVAAFSLAVERDFKDGNGEKAVDYFDCVAWRNTGEFVDKYFAKGSAAVVNGRLQTRSWVDKDGNNRKSVEVKVESIYFAGSKPADQGNQAAQRGGYDNTRTQAEPRYNAFEELYDEDEDLPF